MKELLAKWAAYEPLRCRITSIMSSEPDYEIRIEGTWQQLWGKYPLKLGIIQLALQEAIEIREWSYELWYSERNREALVFYSPEDEIPPANASGDSFASALLKAYLKCFELVAENNTCSQTQ